MLENNILRYHRDYSLRDLTTAESLVLVSYRLWLLHYVQGKSANLPNWRTGLAAVGLSLAADELFDPLAEVTVTGSKRSVEIQPLRCRRISHQEGFILGSHALLQHHLLEEASRTLADWLSPTAGSVAAPLLWRFAMALSTAQLILPLRYTTGQEAEFNALKSPLWQASSSRLH
ncbi:MAG: hypothetical protein M0Q49_11690 [Porticoccaceae bacterium]|nr:hypothetical protein [Porticoccaceae bacterium]